MSRFGNLKVRTSGGNKAPIAPPENKFYNKPSETMNVYKMTKEDFKISIDPNDIAKVKMQMDTIASMTAETFFQQLRKMLDKNLIPYTTICNIILNEFRSVFFDCIDPTGSSNPVNLAVLNASEEYLFKDLKSVVYSYVDGYMKGNTDGSKEFMDAIYRMVNNATTTMGYAGKFDFTSLLYMVFSFTNTFKKN